MAHHLLIVEDEHSLAVGLKFNFELEGYRVTHVDNGPDALAALDAEPTPGEDPVDLVILDLMLPGMSGYEIAKEIRTRDRELPIMVLSARSLAADKAHAFDCGTDQYVTKPFELRELLSRVRNLLERRPVRRGEPPGAGGAHQVGGARIDLNTQTLRNPAGSHELTQLEADLLRLFLTHPGRILDRGEILEKVWGIDADVTTRTVDNFVMRLRRYVEPDPANPVHIQSVRGRGYRLLPSPETPAEEGDAP